MESAFSEKSLGQVHRATTREGNPVAVKIQRAELGLYNYLRQLEASLDTNKLLSSIIDRASSA